MSKKQIRGLGILAQVAKADRAYCIVSAGPSEWLVIERKNRSKAYPKRRIKELVDQKLIELGYEVRVLPKGREILADSAL